MRFSVVVPVFHAEKTLPAAIDSVLSQEGADIELLLVLEDRADPCVPLCLAAQEAHPASVRVLYQVLPGVIQGRRTGVLAATGEITLFLDADDAFAAGAFGRIASAFFENDWLDLLLFNYAPMDENGLVGAPEKPLFADGELFNADGRRLIYEQLIDTTRLNPLWCKAIRTQLLQSDPTDYGALGAFQVGDDLVMSLYPLTRARNIAYSADVLYNYRIAKTGNSFRTELERLPREFSLPMVEMMRSYLPLWGLDTASYRERFFVKQLRGLLSVFFRYFRGARTYAEKKRVVDFDYQSRLLPETMDYLHSKLLSFPRRMQLTLLFHKQTALLYLFDGLGRIFYRKRA